MTETIHPLGGTPAGRFDDAGDLVGNGRRDLCAVQAHDGATVHVVQHQGHPCHLWGFHDSVNL